MGFSAIEIAVCAFVVVLLFGVKRLPDLGSGLGTGISNFRKAFRDGSAIDVEPRTPLDPAANSEKKALNDDLAKKLPAAESAKE